jgi:hypothetical protein
MVGKIMEKEATIGWMLGTIKVDGGIVQNNTGIPHL